MAPTDAAIDVRGLTKAYDGRTVVDGIGFRVPTGTIFALLGPNGAGKTTTVEILEGYRRRDAGDVRVLGLDPERDRDRLMPRIGLMLQQGGMYPQITPREALRLFAAFYPDPEDPEDLLARVELDAVATTRFRRLSGGEKQRLALALALVGKPELVFLDEPTASMDAKARRVTWEMLRGLRGRGVTIFLTTHFMEEAERLADRVAILNHGRLVATGTPTELRGSGRREIRLATVPPVAPTALAAGLGLTLDMVGRDADGALVVYTEPTPALVSALAAWLAEQGALLTELRAGSGSLEEAFLEITSAAAER